MAHTDNTEITAIEQETPRILKSRIPELEARVAKLNRRAAKLGLGEIEITYGVEHVVSEKDRNNKPTGRVWVYVDVVLTGEAPRINGFEFVARIDHESASQNLIKRAPGTEHECPVEYRTAPAWCDHCNTNRRRHDTFVLVCVSDTTIGDAHYVAGQYYRVGRNCLADFLRTPNADKALNVWSLAHECTVGLGEPGEGGGEGRGEYHYRVSDVLAIAAACVRLDGWMSKTVARERDRTSTASDVRTVLNPHPRDDESLKAWRREHMPSAADVVTATSTIEFVLGDEFTGDDDYVRNLKIIVGDEVVAEQNLGLVVSAIACYRRHLGDVAKRKANAALKHLDAAVGKRVEFDAVVTNLNTFDGFYGPTTFVGLKTDKGERIVWKASGVQEFEVGNTYHVRATVKAHGEYRDAPQTVVTRAKLTAA